jgi:hypothetical protein
MSNNEYALVVHTHANPFTDVLKLKYRDFTFFGKDIQIEQNWKPNKKGGTVIGFGASVYHCAIVLASYLESNKDEVKHIIVIKL